MDAEAFHQNLNLHEGIYYFRKAIPKHLAIYFDRKEYKKSLRTGRLKEARQLWWTLCHRTEGFFTMIEKMTSQLTDDKIKALARAYFERCLVDAESALYLEKYLVRDDLGEEFNPDILKAMAAHSQNRLNRLTELKQSHDYSLGEASAARSILRTADISVLENSIPFRELCFGILRAHHEAERINYAYLSGNESDGVIRDPYFSGCEKFQVMTEAGEPTNLTIKEFRLIEALVMGANRVMTREQLLDQARAGNYNTTDRAIDVQILRIRKKIGDMSDPPSIIKAVRGVGYTIETKVEIMA